MAFSYTIDKPARFILVDWNGEFDLQTANDSVDKLYSDPDYDPSFKGIADVRKADFKMSAKELSEHQKFIEEHPKATTAAWAVIATTPRETGLSTLYKNKAAEVHPLNIFSSVEDAKRWLASK